MNEDRILQKLEAIQAQLNEQNRRLDQLEGHSSTPKSVASEPSTGHPQGSGLWKLIVAFFIGLFTSIHFLEETLPGITRGYGSSGEIILDLIGAGITSLFVWSYYKKRRPNSQATPQKPKREHKDLEDFIGGNFLQKAGILITLLGVSFFLKYSFDQGWIGPSGQIAIGLLGGLSFLGLGEFMEKKYKSWAHLMSGAGLVILYFSLFAARNFYELISVELSFAAMILVTFIGGLAAVRYKSLPLAFLCTLGGYLTPLMIGSPQTDPYILMIYSFMLALGVFGISYFKNWPLLNQLALLGTALYSLQAAYFFTEKENLILTVTFLLVFSLMPIYRSLLHKKSYGHLSTLHILATPLFCTWLGYAVLDNFAPNWISIAAFGMAIYYFGLSALAYTRVRDNQEMMLTLMGIFIAFLSIIAPLELDGAWVTSALSVEAAALLYAGLKLNLSGLRIYASILGFISLISLGIDLEEHRPNRQVHPALFSGLVVIASNFVGLLNYRRYQAQIPESEQKTSQILGALANIVAVILITQQIDFYFDKSTLSSSAKQTSISIAWTIYAIALVVVGFMNRWRSARWLGLALLAITILKVLTVDLAGLSSGYRILAFIVLGFFLLVTSFAYQRYKHIIHEKIL